MSEDLPQLLPWSRIEVAVNPDHTDPVGRAALHELRSVGLDARDVRVHRVFFVQGTPGTPVGPAPLLELLVDPVYENGRVGEPVPGQIFQSGAGRAVSVCKKPGVMDPSEASILRALRSRGVTAERAVTGRTYWIDTDADDAALLCAVGRCLANEVIEEMSAGPVPSPRDLPHGHESSTIPEVPLDGLSDDELRAISKRYVLALNAGEMRNVRDHFATLSRTPRLGELETIAQTWSEHCKHKTLTSPIEYVEEGRTESIENLLKETVFGATQKLDKDWCVSVFKDNAGIVRFDDKHDICFKVETHNHPSAIEPYGGAGTGIGGVIRDILGTGLAARPVANTNVFCFGDLDTNDVPKGALHPRRVMKGVVAGVRDYGNRMGIPTVNGAVCFDERYTGNPIVYCGTVGILPRGRSEKAAQPGDRILAVGGRTGRDGVHGATFSSETLHDESDEVSGGAVQIGNPIEEKRVLDSLLRASERDLFTAITDCGAGGFSSAVGEMAEHCGADVQLDLAPLKYAGLNPVEIWISEAQERMVLSVPAKHESEILALFAAEDVEATVIGTFTDTGQLVVRHGEQTIVDLSMEFLHNGLPKTPRRAAWTQPAVEQEAPPHEDLAAELERVLRHGDVCSKEWIVRQYDHEVQAGSAIKPLVGPEGRGPGDAAVVAPVLGSRRGAVIANGITTRYGDLDPYNMAMCAVDEAIRNAVAVGANPENIAILDNFSWGDCNNPEVLGAMVRAARGCHDAALLFRTPFISGKDSLNNEFHGEHARIRIPHTLLISALGQINDVTRAVTSDLKRAGSKLVLVGETFCEMGGALYGGGKGKIPAVRKSAPAVMRAVADAIRSGAVLSCHDLSDGGLATAAAEMAIAGNFGVRIDPAKIPVGEPMDRVDQRLFSESATRFLLEVNDVPQLDVLHAVIGEVTEDTTIDFGDAPIGSGNTLKLSLENARSAFFHWEETLS